MQYWITTHNRHPDPDIHPWHVYLKTDKGDHPSIGDAVLFYECETPFPGREALGPGRKALVGAATVTGVVQPLAAAIGRFKFEIPCTPMATRKLLPYEQVKQTIPSFRRPAGCRSIKETQFRALMRAMELMD